MCENLIVKELQAIATRFTSDPDCQKQLMNEMFLHLVRMRTVDPDRELNWYLKGCEGHARSILKPVESARVSMARSFDETGPVDCDRRAVVAQTSPVVGQIEIEGERIIQGERINGEVVSLLLPLLTDMQQQVLFLLMKGCGVREAGRQLGITHPAVIKHRKKIARIAHELLQESEGIGVAVAVRDGATDNGNGNGHSAEENNGNNGESHQAA